jgi:CRP/FNR family transcriptional regulator, nitrogen oxide reductase regulator
MPLDIQLIAGLPAFQGFPPADLAAILAEAHSARYPKGAAIFEQGAPAASFFLLLHGRVRAHRLTPEGQQVVARFVGPGEMFGIAMAIGSPLYPANATAVVDSVAIVWPTAAWQKLVTHFPALALSTMRTMGGRLQEAHTRLTETATQEVPRRVANTLLRLAGQAGREVEAGVLIDFPITRQDIAEMAGTTLHTVSRILSAWEQERLVECGRQRVLLCDPERIRAIAEPSAEDAGRY